MGGRGDCLKVVSVSRDEERVESAACDVVAKLPRDRAEFGKTEQGDPRRAERG